ncbi:MAG: hypothetical protein IPH80_38505 [Myxococcales bacterium]|nr:hypothetical protein [Myxococcales bacterium]
MRRWLRRPADRLDVRGAGVGAGCHQRAVAVRSITRRPNVAPRGRADQQRALVEERNNVLIVARPAPT